MLLSSSVRCANSYTWTFRDVGVRPAEPCAWCTKSCPSLRRCCLIGLEFLERRSISIAGCVARMPTCPMPGTDACQPKGLRDRVTVEQLRAKPEESVCVPIVRRHHHHCPRPDEGLRSAACTSRLARRPARLNCSASRIHGDASLFRRLRAHRPRRDGRGVRLAREISRGARLAARHAQGRARVRWPALGPAVRWTARARRPSTINGQCASHARAAAHRCPTTPGMPAGKRGIDPGPERVKGRQTASFIWTRGRQYRRPLAIATTVADRARPSPRPIRARPWQAISRALRPPRRC